MLTFFKLQTHLQNIRLIDVVGEETKSETGSDGYHPDNDPLWTTEEIKHLLHGRPKLDEDARKAARKRYHADYYEKHKAEKDRLDKMYFKKEITEEEHAQRIVEFNRGWYGTDFRLQKLCGRFRHFRENFRKLYSTGSRDENPLPYQWPTTPSVEAYLEILCFCLPVGRLLHTKDPTKHDLARTVKVALSADKDYLDDYISRDKRKSIASVFNASCDLMEVKLNSMDRTDKRNFLTNWEERRDRYILSLAGSTKAVPSIVFFDLVALTVEQDPDTDTDKDEAEKKRREEREENDSE